MRSARYERIDCTDLIVQIMSADWSITWELKGLKFFYSKTLKLCTLDIVLHILLMNVERGLFM